jgi:signal peptidase II
VPDVAGPPTPTPSAPSPDGAVGSASPPGLHLVWWLSFAVIGLDQAIKALVAATLPLYDSIAVIPGALNIVHVRNTGVAFGLFTDLDGSYRGIVTLTLALVALAGIAYYARQLRREETLARLGLSLILGGAIGNLIDRVRVGYVLDFVDVYVGDWHFWAFNVADASITMGAILVFADLLVVSRHASDSV